MGAQGSKGKGVACLPECNTSRFSRTQTRVDYPLHEASAHNDISAVTTLLNNGVDPNAFDVHVRLLLMRHAVPEICRGCPCSLACGSESPRYS
jgi:hypothetical protein